MAVGSSQYPTSLDTAVELLTAVNNLETTLATALTIGATSAVLTSASGLPSSGVVTLYRHSGNSRIEIETISYTGISTNTLTGLTRGFDSTTAQAHAVGSIVEQGVCAVFHNALRVAILALEAKQGITASTPTVGKSLIGDTTAGTSVWRVLVAGDIPTIAQSQVTSLVSDLALKSPLASPTLTGTPLAPTAAAATNTTQIATTAFVRTEVSNLVASAPAALDTLNELAAALGNDASFSTTVTNSLALKSPLASPTFTGTPAAPTATAGTNTTQLATTAFIQAFTGTSNIVTVGTIASGTWNGAVIGATYGGAGTISGLLKANGSGTVSAAVSATDYAPATSGSAILKGNGSGGFSAASAGTDYQAAGSYVTALTGDATASGPGSAALTLATVNVNVGSFGGATKTLTATVNAKGLVTAFAETAIAIAQSQVTNLTSDLALKAPLASPALTGAVVVTSTNAQAFRAGANGATNPAFSIKCDTASIATGIEIQPAAAGGGVTIQVITSGTNEPLTIAPAGSGLLTVATATGGMRINGGLYTTASKDTSVGWNTGVIEVSSTGQFGFSATSDATAVRDVLLTRAGVANLQLGAAAAASPVAQTLSTQGSRAATDSNVAGAGLTIQSGTGTGNATPSSLLLQSPVAVASGTGAQTQTTGLKILNGAAVLSNYTVATLPSASVAGAGALVFLTDVLTLTAITGLGLAPTGGGSNKVPAYSDGTQWLLL